MKTGAPNGAARTIGLNVKRGKFHFVAHISEFKSAGTGSPGVFGVGWCLPRHRARVTGVQPQDVLGRAMALHNQRSGRFNIIAFALAGLFLLLPVWTAASAFTDTRAAEYCKKYQPPPMARWAACVERAGFSFDCDKSRDHARCHEVIDSCKKSAVTQADIDRCAAHARNGELFKAALMLLPSLAIAAVAFALTRKDSGARALLAEALQPGKLRAVQPYVLVSTVYAVTINEKIIFVLHLHDGRSVEMSALKGQLPGVLQALARQNPGCDFGDLTPLLSQPSA